jgi:hypothetical protein
MVSKFSVTKVVNLETSFVLLFHVNLGPVALGYKEDTKMLKVKIHIKLYYAVFLSVLHPDMH